MAEFVDTRPVELATFRCPRCRRKMEELARARLTCPLCGVRMVKQKAGPVLVDFQCPDCSRRLAAVPSAVVRCKCGQVMETTQAVAIGRETAVLSAKSRPEKAVFNEFHAEKRCFGTGVGDDGGTA
jgi:tRNA(Ile2) C34 agmatinyltransferase TiaS